MNFLHSELDVVTGQVVHVELAGNAANVRLFDDANFGRYRDQDRPIHHAGGFYSQSPVVLKPPWPGHWHVVIDLGDKRGEVRAAVSVRQVS